MLGWLRVVKLSPEVELTVHKIIHLAFVVKHSRHTALALMKLFDVDFGPEFYYMPHAYIFFRVADEESLGHK